MLSIKTNRPKLVSMCRYKLVTYWQNFMEILLNLSENIAKSFRGDTFFWLTLYVCVSGYCRSVATGDHYRFVDMSVSRLCYVPAFFLMILFVSILTHNTCRCACIHIE